VNKKTEKQKGKFAHRQSRRPNPPEKRSPRSTLWSPGGLSTVERQAFPKHRGTRPTPGGGRQQVTTEQTYTNNSRERFYSPSFLSLSPFSLLFSFSLPFSSWLSTSRSFSNNRYIDHLRKLDVMSSIRESRNVHTYVKLEEEGNLRRAIANPSLPYVGCGRPRTSVHPSFMLFEGSPSTA